MCVYRVMDARGKFGEHERCVRVAQGGATLPTQLTPPGSPWMTSLCQIVVVDFSSFLFENIPRQTFKRILATAQPGGFCLRLASSRPISLRWARQILLGHFCLAFMRLKSSVDNYLAGSKKCSLFASLRNLCKFFGLFSQYLITCILWFHGQSVHVLKREKSRKGLVGAKSWRRIASWRLSAIMVSIFRTVPHVSENVSYTIKCRIICECRMIFRHPTLDPAVPNVTYILFELLKVSARM